MTSIGSIRGASHQEVAFMNMVHATIAAHTLAGLQPAAMLAQFNQSCCESAFNTTSDSICAGCLIPQPSLKTASIWRLTLTNEWQASHPKYWTKLQHRDSFILTQALLSTLRGRMWSTCQTCTLRRISGVQAPWCRASMWRTHVHTYKQVHSR